MTPEQVRRAASAARIAVSDADAEALASELTAILGSIEALPEVVGEHGGDAEEVHDLPPPLTGPAGPDPLVIPVARLAPEWRDGLFTVPRPSSHSDEPGR